MKIQSVETHLERSHPVDNRDALHPIPRTIAAGLSELGLSAPPCRGTTFLVRDGHCAGRRFLFDGVQAVWLFAENVVHFYGEDGRVMKSIGVERVERTEAA